MSKRDEQGPTPKNPASSEKQIRAMRISTLDWWLLEAFLQVRLLIAWRGLEFLLRQTSNSDAQAWANRLKSDAIDPLWKCCWLPSCAPKVRGDFRQYLVERPIESIAESSRNATAMAQVNPDKEFESNRGCVAWNFSVKVENPTSHAVGSWLSVTEALAGWEPVRIGLENLLNSQPFSHNSPIPPEKDEELWRLSQTCFDLTSNITKRNRATTTARLTSFSESADRELFQTITNGLDQCRRYFEKRRDLIAQATRQNRIKPEEHGSLTWFLQEIQNILEFAGSQSPAWPPLVLSQWRDELHRLLASKRMDGSWSSWIHRAKAPLNREPHYEQMFAQEPTPRRAKILLIRRLEKAVQSFDPKDPKLRSVIGRLGNLWDVEEAAQWEHDLAEVTAEARTGSRFFQALDYGFDQIHNLALSTRFLAARELDPTWRGWNSVEPILAEMVSEPARVKINTALSALSRIYHRFRQLTRKTAPSTQSPTNTRSWSFLPNANSPSNQSAPHPMAVRSAYRQLIRRLIDILERESNADLLPTIDKRSLRLLPIAKDLLASQTIQRKANSKPPGTILRVRRFGVVNKLPSHLDISIGSIPPEAAPWLNDISPKIPVLPERNPVTRLCAEVRKCWEAANLSESWPKLEHWARQTIPAWLNHQEGESWFHALAQTAWSETRSSDPSRHASTFFKSIVRLTPELSDKGLVSHPQIDLNTGRCFWPQNVPLSQGCQAQFDDRAPLREAIRVDQFATTPKSARCQISLGPRTKDGWLDLAASLVERARAFSEASGADDQAKELHLAAEALMHTEISIALDGQNRAEAFAANSAERRLLLQLATTSRALSNTSSLRAKAWISIQESFQLWTKRSGCEITPQWKSHEPLTMEPSWKQNWMFHSSAVKGAVMGITKLGVKRLSDGRVLQTPALEISAGPAPEHYDQLMALVRELGSKVAVNIEEPLQHWPTAEVNGELEGEVLAFYLDYFGDTASGWEASIYQVNPDWTRRFREVFGELLLKRFEYYTFSPESLYDYPSNWLEIRRRDQYRSGGKIVRVIRPGLHWNQQLKWPAVIETE